MKYMGCDTAVRPLPQSEPVWRSGCRPMGAHVWAVSWGNLCVFTESLNKDKSRSFLANQARQEVQFSK